MDWFYLALICALTVALADAFTKKGLSQCSTTSIMLIRFSVPGLILVPLSLYYGLPTVPNSFWLYFIPCVPLELLTMWLYITAIRNDPLHLTLPFLAFTPVFNIVTGYVVLGEEIKLLGFMGILLVVLGTYILNIDQLKHSWRDAFAPFKAIVHVRGSVLMLLVAALYSITSVLSKGAMQYTTPEKFGAFYFVVIGLVALVLTLLFKPKAIVGVWQRPQYMLLVSVFMAIMVVTHFLAIAKVEVAYMISVKRTSLLFGLLLGYWMFKDGKLIQHFPAALIMVLGVTLILFN